MRVFQQSELEGKREFSFTVFGHLYSMKNSKILTTTGGRPHSVKHPKVKQFERDFQYQVPAKAKLGITGDVAVTVIAFYPSRRQDLDPSVVYDLLQHSGVIENDRQVKIKHEEWKLDKENPRVEITVREL